MSMAFIDLDAQRRRLGPQLEQALAKAVLEGQYILGPQVAACEAELAAMCGARHAVTCANGTDALELVLMAWGVGRGDAVFVPSFTFASTAEVVALLGATPVFVDIDPDSFNMSPESLAAAIDSVRAEGKLAPKAVIPVDLFGQPADYDALLPVIQGAGLKCLCDGAQGFAAGYKGKRVGGIGDAATTSFFPAKPLGCYGDGGAIFTGDDDLAAVLGSLRVHGKGSDKYDNVRVGRNSRLDTLQAAILLVKLSVYEEEIEARNRIADRYAAGLGDICAVPRVIPDARSVWAQYTIRAPERDRVQAELKQAGVPTAVYYPKPLHLQTAYRAHPAAPGGLPHSEAAAAEVLSLPMHPYLSETDQDRVIAALRRALGDQSRAVAG
jgi:dTDP-4-amino-4,6-dideoxygalactose transaminase